MQVKLLYNMKLYKPRGTKDIGFVCYTTYHKKIVWHDE